MATTSLAPGLVSDDEVTVERIPMSYEAYLDWYDKEAGRRGEWVDGEVIPFLRSSVRHAETSGFLLHLIASYLETRPVGEEFTRGVELRTRDGSAREPDLQVVLIEHADRIEEMRVRGAADLVVEIISPDSVARDRRDKLAEYAAAGVPEYWIVDPRTGHEAIDLFQLNAESDYERAAEDSGGRLASQVLPGLWMDAAWLTAATLPPAGKLGTEMALTAD